MLNFGDRDKVLAGWLYLFRILCIMWPIISLLLIIINYYNMKNAGFSFYTVKSAIGIEMYLLFIFVLMKYIIFIIYCIYIASNLTNLKPVTISIVKTFLKVAISMNLFIILYCFVSGLRPWQVGDIVGAAFWQMIFCILWFLYFIKSRRVKETYIPLGQARGSEIIKLLGIPQSEATDSDGTKIMKYKDYLVKLNQDDIVMSHSFPLK